MSQNALLGVTGRCLRMRYKDVTGTHVSECVTRKSQVDVSECVTRTSQVDVSECVTRTSQVRMSQNALLGRHRYACLRMRY